MWFQLFNATQEMQFLFRLGSIYNHSLYFDNIDKVMQSSAWPYPYLQQKPAFSSVQSIKSLSHSFSAVISGNWLAQPIIIFSQITGFSKV